MTNKHGRRHWTNTESWQDDWEGHTGSGGRLGGRRRMFDNGELRLILLHLINEEPRHGYDLIRAIEGLSRGAYAPSPGVVYPTLTMLKDLDLISEPDTDNLRKLFSITPQGRAELEANGAVVTTLLQRLSAVAQIRERIDATPVRRAMHNLKSVLFNKLSAETDRETVLQLVALIDEAAQKIERL